MPSRASSTERSKNSNLLARSVVEDLIVEHMDDGSRWPPERQKNLAAVALAMLGAFQRLPRTSGQSFAAQAEPDRQEGGTCTLECRLSVRGNVS